MQPILPIRFFGFLVVLSKGQVFKAIYFAWSILSILLCLPLDILFDNCGFLSGITEINETLWIVVEGFFSFAFNEWRDDFIMIFLL